MPPKFTKPRANAAVVHGEFEQIEVIDPDNPEQIIKKSSCKHCPAGHRFKVLTGRNPTNLRDHIRSFHADVELRLKGIIKVSIDYQFKSHFKTVVAADDAKAEAKARSQIAMAGTSAAEVLCPSPTVSGTSRKRKEQVSHPYSDMSSL